MISSLAFTFVILPCIGAVAIAAAVKDWRLAAAALCGALALIFIAPSIGGGLLLFGLPVFAGVALGALALLIGLPRRPDMDIWGRMLTALAVAFFASFLNLLLIGAGG